MGAFKYFLIVFMLVYIITPCHVNGNGDEEYKNDPRALPCPDPIKIIPCVCSVDESMIMKMDCSNVTSEDQLKAVFSIELPFKDFNELRIDGNQYLISLRENDLGDATFQIITIINSILEIVESDALIGSASTVTKIDLFNNEIEFFPFEEMTLYNKLNYLTVSNNPISVYPAIKSTTIRYLELGGNQILNLPADALDTLPNISHFHLHGNPLKEILPGTFTGSTLLRDLNLNGCGLTNISPFTIEFFTSSASLDISYNKISDVAVNATIGVTGILFLQGNKLTELKEEVWLPVMESASYFYVYENPLLCGCDIAWIILNPTNMAKLYGQETCSDGELLVDLDPAIYENFC